MKRPDDRFDEFYLWTQDDRQRRRTDWAFHAVWIGIAALALGFWVAVVWAILTFGGFL